MRLWRVGVVLAVALSLAVIGWPAGTVLAGPNGGGGGGSPAPGAILPLDGTWLDFSFGDVGSFSDPSPFTFHVNPGQVAHVTVTDAFCTGDRFAIFDNGGLVGNTSVPGTTSCEDPDGTGNPDLALLSSHYSHGTFNFGSGDHSITIQAIASPFEGGGAFIRGTVENLRTGGAAVGGVGLSLAEQARENRERANAAAAPAQPVSPPTTGQGNVAITPPSTGDAGLAARQDSGWLATMMVVVIIGLAVSTGQLRRARGR